MDDKCPACGQAVDRTFDVEVIGPDGEVEKVVVVHADCYLILQRELALKLALPDDPYQSEN